MLATRVRALVGDIRKHMPAFSAISRAASVAPASATTGVISGRASALAAAIRQIEKQFGKGAIMQLNGTNKTFDIAVVPTGSLALDAALGIGGLPFGRVVELYGPESSGKTTLALHVIAEAQKMGKSACFIDAEHALDSHYASALGVDLKSLYLTQPDTGEQALEIADTLVRSGGIDVIVIDSVAALVPKAEIEGEMGDQHMALQARLMSQALRKLTASLSKSKALIIFLNQIRSKVGVIFGSPDVTPGGNALKFYSSIRMEIRRTGQIKRGEEIVGNTTRVKVAKNKLAPPFRVADFEMTYGTGISRVAEAIDVGVTAGIIGKCGSWYSFLHQDLVDTVNKVLAATPASDAPLADVAVAAAPADAKKGKKPKKQPVPSFTDATDSSPVSPAAHNNIEVGDNFMQGKENMKAFFDAHPSVLETSIRLIRTNLKDIRLDIVDGKTEAKKISAAASPSSGGLAADLADADELLGGLEASAGDEETPK